MHGCYRSSLDEAQLASFGVYDATHRQKILSKLNANAGGEDFDDMLGDLDSVIKDLEMFTVVSNANFFFLADCKFSIDLEGKAYANVSALPFCQHGVGAQLWLDLLWPTPVLAALLMTTK